MKRINRNVILRKRNRLSREERDIKSSIIKKKLFDSAFYKEAKTVMFYVSFGSEADTSGMIKEALKEKKVCVPVVEADGMTASEISKLGDLSAKNRYEIPEPSEPKKIDKDKIDLIIVPGVVFDKRNHRIGYGKGYYDSFLNGFKGRSIGLAFGMQVLEIIPRDEWDVQLDYVISDA